MTDFPNRPLRGIFIPVSILTDPTLSGLDKILLAILQEFDTGDGCSLSRNQMAYLAGCSLETVSSALTRLGNRKRAKPLPGGVFMLTTPGTSASAAETPSKKPKRLPITKETPNYPPEQVTFINWFYKTQHVNFPRMVPAIPTEVQIAKCIHVFDQLQRLDKYNWEEIKAGVEWGVRDEFWGRNVLSPTGLRQICRNGVSKFSNLFEGMNRGTRKRSDTPTGDLKDISRICPAFESKTKNILSPDTLYKLKTKLGELWTSLPGESTKPYIVLPNRSSTPRRSIKFLLRAQSRLVDYMKMYIDDEVYEKASGAFLLGVGWPKFTQYLEKKLGHRLTDGTPLR